MVIFAHDDLWRTNTILHHVFARRSPVFLRGNDEAISNLFAYRDDRLLLPAIAGFAMTFWQFPNRAVSIPDFRNHSSPKHPESKLPERLFRPGNLVIEPGENQSSDEPIAESPNQADHAS